MPGWVGDLTVAEIVAWLAGLGAVGYGIKRLWPGLRRLVHLFDDLAGTPGRPGVEARPGLMERLASVETTQESMAGQIKAINHEVHANSGKSLKDVATQTADHVNRLDGRVERIEGHLGLTEAR